MEGLVQGRYNGCRSPRNRSEEGNPENPDVGFHSAVGAHGRDADNSAANPLPDSVLSHMLGRQETCGHQVQLLDCRDLVCVQLRLACKPDQGEAHPVC